MPRLHRFFTSRPGALITLALATSVASLTCARAHASNSPLPGFLISGNFGRGKIRIDSVGTAAFSSEADRLAIRAASDPTGLQSTDADSLLSRSTQDRFVVPAITASAALSAAVTSEVVRAVRGKQAINFRRLYQDALVATASGFAVGTLASPGLTNHYMARAVLDASLRYLSKISWMGSASRASAGSFETDLIVGALRGALQSRIPMEALTWLPCQKQDLAADVCNGLHALVVRSLLQGSEEVASQLLSRALQPGNPRNSADLLASFLRGGAFGAIEQGAIEVVLGAPQWMSPDDRRIVSDAFRRSGLSEGTAECFEKNTFLYGGLWSAFTTEDNLNFNIGTTTMVDREFFFLNDTSPGMIGLHAHEVGGHCTQWLNLGLVNFLSRYLFAFFSRGEDPHRQSVASIEDGAIECTGNTFECEADAIQTIILREERSGI